MRLPPQSRFAHMPAMKKQRGVVLFFTLVALVAMMLAAVALIRSVDTSTLIAGNIAFKQAATTSGDSGVEAAMNWLATTQTANSGINVLNDASHPFNVTGGTGSYTNVGYYSNEDSTVSLTDGTGIVWDNTDSTLVGTDATGNTTRYIIQRMCRTANQPVQSANCLFSGAVEDQNGQNIPLPQDVCTGAGCPSAGQAPMMRITSRTTGPKNTVSYVQAFVY